MNTYNWRDGMKQQETITIHKAFAWALAREFGDLHVIDNNKNARTLSASRFVRGLTTTEMDTAQNTLSMYKTAANDHCNADRPPDIGLPEIVQEVIGEHLSADQIVFTIKF